MGDMIFLNGRKFRRIEELPSLDTDGPVILCEDDDGKRYVCSSSAWKSAAIKTDLSARVNRSSTPQEKIGLFMSLFHGREDVYAKRYYSFKTQKSGYTPVCQNDWARGVCDHKKYKCPSCPNRLFTPLTSEIVRRHLVGADEYERDVIGIYPMLEDETTWFLCADFDDEGWQEDVAAFRDSAREIGLVPAVERSRSGSGGHVWFFFEHPVSASTARKLGSGLLTRAMERRHELSFKSYDRLFPSQDTMPKGGFGNLIALPFQGKAQKKQNSLFVDESFIPYPDQWAFLSELPRITEEELDRCVAALCVQGDVGVLAEGDEAKPWERKRSGNKRLSAMDFPSIVRLTLADMLYVEKDGISQLALNRFKRYAAFRNSDYYKSQAMRLPIYNKPRVIDCVDETGEYLILPRGCLSSVTDTLDDIGVGYIIDDRRSAGKNIDVSFNGELREEQKPAAEALLGYETGVLSATTAFGKTVVGAYLIGARKVNTLILVHSSALLSQWKEALEKFLRIEETLPELPRKRGRRKQRSLIGQLGGGKNTLSGIVDIAIIQSLFEGEEKAVKELVGDYGMVICDECHHVAAFSFEKALKAVRAKYVYGLSATPTRQDGHHPIIFMQCGPIRYSVDAKSQAERRDFSHYVIPRPTKTRLPDTNEIQGVYKALIQNEMRNAMILQDVADAVASGRTPILLTERTEHARELAAALQDQVQNVIVLVGSDPQREKREKLAQLKAVPSDKSLVIIATGKYIGEGFDEPRLDTLFLAMPISWKGKLAQYVGRLHRSYEGKHDVRVFDYVDIHVPVLERMYQKRLRGYAELGYQTMSTEKDATPSLIYTGDTYADVFYADIAGAGRSVVLACPTMSKRRVSEIMEKLLSKIEARAITIITRPLEDIPLERQNAAASILCMLAEAGVSVIHRNQMTQRFAVIDETITWYGSINYLGFAKTEDTAIRIESAELSGELCEEYMRQEDEHE